MKMQDKQSNITNSLKVKEMLYCYSNLNKKKKDQDYTNAG